MEFKDTLGTYGRMRMEFMQEHRPGTYDMMLLEGTLADHLRSVDKRADEMSWDLQMKMEKEELDWSLQGTDFERFVAQRQNIAARVREIIMNELVFV